LSKIILQGHIIVADAELGVVTNALVNHSALTKAEVGCLIFEVTPDSTNLNKFFVYEEFVDQAAFDKHQTRVKQSTWGEISKNVQRHYQITHSTRSE